MKEEDKNNKEMIKLIQDISGNLEQKNTDKKYPKIIVCSDYQTEEEKQLQEKGVDLSFQKLYPNECINFSDLRPDIYQFHEGEPLSLTEERLLKVTDYLNKHRKSIKQNPQKQVLIHDKLIDNFSEGAEERLKRSPIFNSIFHSLLNGQSPYKVIEDLCNIHDNMCIEHSKQMIENVRPVMKVDIKDIHKIDEISKICLFDQYKNDLKNLKNLQNPNNNNNNND